MPINATKQCHIDHIMSQLPFWKVKESMQIFKWIINNGQQASYILVQQSVSHYTFRHCSLNAKSGNKVPDRCQYET